MGTWRTLSGQLAAACMLLAPMLSNARPAVLATGARDNQQLTLAPAPGPLPDGRVGVPYKATIQVSGGNPPYHWTRGGQLPPGLTTQVTGTNSDTYVISGTPTECSAMSWGVSPVAFETAHNYIQRTGSGWYFIKVPCTPSTTAKGTATTPTLTPVATVTATQSITATYYVPPTGGASATATIPSTTAKGTATVTPAARASGTTTQTLTPTPLGCSPRVVANVVFGPTGLVWGLDGPQYGVADGTWYGVQISGNSFSPNTKLSIYIDDVQIDQYSHTGSAGITTNAHGVFSAQFAVKPSLLNPPGAEKPNPNQVHQMFVTDHARCQALYIFLVDDLDKDHAKTMGLVLGGIGAALTVGGGALALSLPTKLIPGVNITVATAGGVTALVGGVVSGIAVYYASVANDPPDPNFRNVIQPQPVSVRLTVSQHASAAFARAVQALISNLANHDSVLQAMTVSLNRAGSALDAHALSCAALQHQAVMRYAAAADTLLARRRSLIQGFLNAIPRQDASYFRAPASAVQTAAQQVAAGDPTLVRLWTAEVGPVWASKLRGDLRLATANVKKPLRSIDLLAQLAKLRDTADQQAAPLVATSWGYLVTANPQACR